MLTISTAPHITSANSVQRIMLDVIVALVPAMIAAVLFFGLDALLLIVTTVAACVLFEFLCCKYMLKIKNSAFDLSAVITGILLSFNLPANFPLFLTLIGAFVAIVAAKMLYGGIGKNVFNPALAGRVFLFICFPLQMTVWPVPQWLKFANVDVQTSATTLNLIKNMDVHSSASSHFAAGGLPSYADMFLGNIGGCIGEVSTLALLLGFAYMLYRKVISWHIPTFFIGTVFVLNGIVWLFVKTPQFEPLTQILSGGLMLGAIFMATDYVTSPMALRGKILFAVACGFLTFLIRQFGAYPEGVSFAILIMNAFVPLIDKYIKPRRFGAGR